MNIEGFIKIQNREYVFAVNRKLGNVLPDDLITRQLAAGNDVHSIAQLIVKTKNELTKSDNAEKKTDLESTVTSGFTKFVNWIRRLKS
ncbi:MAG: hypothetical protein ABJK37_22680 [Paraglaciecola sp.]|uniref:hypothetical protein n=1 Tax=Paraglaciecola sp. TaxID=1920173 RepID=UPI003297C4BA